MTDEDYGALCQRIGCEHTRAAHLNGDCDICSMTRRDDPDAACGYFLDPDYDDEPDQRRSRQ